MSEAFPVNATDLSNARLTRLVQTVHRDAAVEGYVVRGEKYFGEDKGEVSTAGRIELDLRFAPPAAGTLPERAIVKVCRPDIQAQPLYKNEVGFYTRLRGDLDIEAPLCLGGEFDAASGTFGLALEDLRERGAIFPNVKTAVTLPQIRSLLDALAGVHARFWESPRFDDDLSWVESHVHGDIHNFFNHPDGVPAIIRHEIAVEQFKREMTEGIGQTADSLFDQTRRVQLHQATLPRTLCHGDTHIGNTYLLPGDRGGLLDWQLMARGFCLHDVTYLIVTGLPVAQRRAHERELIGYYLERLRALGVTNAPDMETMWLEHRRAVAWGVYIGWLTTSIDNYGWDICVCNHVRLMTAYHDLGTAEAVADLPG